MRKKIRFINIIAIILILSSTVPCVAHSGRTDSNGGHRVYDEYGNVIDYHFHHGYPAHYHNADGSCPYLTQEQSSNQDNQTSSYSAPVYDEDDTFESDLSTNVSESIGSDFSPMVIALVIVVSVIVIIALFFNSNERNDNFETNNIKKDNKRTSNNPKCPCCGASMVKRFGENGFFYGCVNYPKCKGTRKID